MDSKSKSQRDQELDKALKETFPASDPVSTNEADDHPVRPAGRKPPRFDKALIDRLAKKVADKHPRGGSGK